MQDGHKGAGSVMSALVCMLCIVIARFACAKHFAKMSEVHEQYFNKAVTIVVLLACCSSRLEGLPTPWVGTWTTGGRERVVQGLIAPFIALWSAEDETWGPVPAASKGSRTL